MIKTPFQGVYILTNLPLRALTDCLMARTNNNNNNNNNNDNNNNNFFLLINNNKTLFQLSKQLVNIYNFKLYIEIVYKF